MNKIKLKTRVKTKIHAWLEICLQSEFKFQNSRRLVNVILSLTLH